MVGLEASRRRKNLSDRRRYLLRVPFQELFISYIFIKRNGTLIRPAVKPSNAYQINRKGL